MFLKRFPAQLQHSHLCFGLYYSGALWMCWEGYVHYVYNNTVTGLLTELLYFVSYQEELVEGRNYSQKVPIPHLYLSTH